MNNEDSLNLITSLQLGKPDHKSKFDLIQANIKGFMVRLKFEAGRTKLLEELNLLVQKYQNQYRTPTLYKAESFLNVPFDPNKWKKYYPENDTRFTIDFGFVLFTKLLLYEDISMYSGNINLRNQKHGFGTLLTREGLKYQGSWFNDRLCGWSRFIDIDGNILEGRY